MFLHVEQAAYGIIYFYNDCEPIIFHRYIMMRKCWEIVPENRPSFNELYKTTSKYIEQMAGYLELGFNPFSGVESVTCMEMKEEDEVTTVSSQETPAPAEICESKL